MGDTKNHRVIRLPRICCRSLKWTLRALTIATRPIVKIDWTKIMIGRVRRGKPTSLLKKIIKRNKSGRLNKKFIKFESTLTIGKTSGGSIDLVISEPPAITEFTPSISEDENHIHGRRPQNKKTA